jgi:hypothetical protein
MKIVFLEILILVRLVTNDGILLREEDHLTEV